MKKQTINNFINKFSEIPEEKWTTDHFFSESKKNKKVLGIKVPFLKETFFKCCAQGHCITEDEMFDFLFDLHHFGYRAIISDYPELQQLYIITQDPEDKENITIASVNNGNNPKYTQETAKERVLAFLYDLLAEENEKTNVNSEEQFTKQKQD
jgi:hypothetical protein